VLRADCRNNVNGAIRQLRKVFVIFVCEGMVSERHSVQQHVITQKNRNM
jgi:hypothetical protein